MSENLTEVAEKTPEEKQELLERIKKHYAWMEENRVKAFASWVEELEYARAEGFELVPPDYRIPHWATVIVMGEVLPTLFIMRADKSFEEFRLSNGKEARVFGYPLFFRKDVYLNDSTTKLFKQNLESAFSELPTDIRNALVGVGREVLRAREKHPGNKHLFAALGEEVGEVAKELLEAGTKERLWAECMQVACVALRLALEGDADFKDEVVATNAVPSIQGGVARLREDENGTWLTIKPQGYPHALTLPVITKGSRANSNAWTWNGDLEKPTLKPSVRTQHGNGVVSHLWVTDGQGIHLADSTDGLAGQTLPLQTLTESDF